jgi:23S rRNA pseudouridine1911/1915/1917 synthase
VRVIYCDPSLLVVDKPAGILVHGDGTGARTLSDLVADLLAERGEDPRVQAVQRLDMETTGLVLFSRDKATQPALDAQIARHEMRKRYLVLIEGRLRADGGDEWLDIEAPLGRDRHDSHRMRVNPRGKASHTRVHTLARKNGRSLLLVELLTGRRHQIRVHLAHLGHPIVGDTLYGGVRNASGLMLHALELTLTHPATGELLELRTETPERFQPYLP